MTKCVDFRKFALKQPNPPSVAKRRVCKSLVGDHAIGHAHYPYPSNANFATSAKKTNPRGSTVLRVIVEVLVEFWLEKAC